MFEIVFCSSEFLILRQLDDRSAPPPSAYAVLVGEWWWASDLGLCVRDPRPQPLPAFPWCGGRLCYGTVIHNIQSPPSSHLANLKLCAQMNPHPAPWPAAGVKYSLSLGLSLGHAVHDFSCDWLVLVSLELVPTVLCVKISLIPCFVF